MKRTRFDRLVSRYIAEGMSGDDAKELAKAVLERRPAKKLHRRKFSSLQDICFQKRRLARLVMRYEKKYSEVPSEKTTRLAQGIISGNHGWGLRRSMLGKF